MDELKTIREDDRPVTKLWFPGEEGNHYWAVGEAGVTHIVAYAENGQMEVVPWFAVYQGERIANRVNAAHVEDVEYAESG